MKYLVYWIRRIIHNDITEDGYVGITKHFNQRINFHKKYNKDNLHLKNALEKFNDIIIDVIMEGSEEQCRLKEFELRPKKGIGWNIAEGGNVPPNAKNRKWTNEHRNHYMETIKQNNSNYRTEEQRQRQMQTRKINGYVDGKNLDVKYIKDSFWWNNGVEEYRSFEKPDETWQKGRIKGKKYGKK